MVKANKYRQIIKKLVFPSLYIFAVTTLLSYLYYDWAYDDPFITYRYAQNLANGLGFVYNQGSRVQSTTTPLFTIILAALYPFWADIPHLAIFLGAFSLAIGAIFLWELAQTLQTPIVGWASLLLFPTFPLLLPTLGSETPIYLAFCLGAFTFYSRRRYDVSAIFSALAVLSRPDGVLIPLILAAHYLILIRQQIPWRSILIFLILTLPWFIFAWGYFGSPIPATLAAKQQQGIMYISQRFVPGLLTIVKQYSNHWYYWVEAILALSGIIFMVLRARAWVLFLTWTALYFIAYSLLGVSRYFWYYATLVPGFIVLIGLGLTTILYVGDQLLKQPDFKKTMGQRFQLFLVIGLILFVFIGQGISVWQLHQRVDSRLPIYRAVGEWINANTPKDAQIATLEVGIIGYYAQRHIVGFAGLLQPEVGNQLTFDSTYEDAALWATENYQPDYLVLVSGLFTRLEQGYIAQHCQVIEQFPGKLYGFRSNLNILSCINE